MPVRKVKARTISRRGRYGDSEYPALQIEVQGFKSPYASMSMPAIAHKALSREADAYELFDKLAKAINEAQISISSGPRDAAPAK